MIPTITGRRTRPFSLRGLEPTSPYAQARRELAAAPRDAGGEPPSLDSAEAIEARRRARLALAEAAEILRRIEKEHGP